MTKGAGCLKLIGAAAKADLAQGISMYYSARH
jgi:hypothetical protein